MVSVTKLNEYAEQLLWFADGLKAPYIIPSTKELMLNTMLLAAQCMEDTADTLKQNPELDTETCHVEEASWVSSCPTWLCIECHESFESARGDYLFCPYCGREVEWKEERTEE